MPALSFRLLATCITACSALSTPAQSLDRTTNIEWQTFVVQEFGTRVQYPANIFVPAGRPGKGIGQKFKSADGRAELSIYSIQNEAGETPATYLRRNLRMDRSALDYTRIARSFFAISSERDGIIYTAAAIFRAPAGQFTALTFCIRKRRSAPGMLSSHASACPCARLRGE